MKVSPLSLGTINSLLPNLRETFWVFDWDGTLIDIAPTPDSIIVPPEVLQHLGILQKHCRRVAIISGRALHDLEQRIPLPELSLIGNHGAEWRIDHQHGTWKLSDSEKRELKGATATLFNLAEQFPASTLENKEWTVSFHVRNLAPPEKEQVQLAISHEMQQFPHLEIRPANACWEVRPLGTPNKGDALKRLIDAEVTPLVFGDDWTDEDMFFASPKNAITVVVGKRRPTHARYSLSSPEELRALLAHITNNLLS